MSAIYNACSWAAKEALEEAGVKGGVHGKLLGIHRQRKLGKTCTVKVLSVCASRGSTSAGRKSTGIAVAGFTEEGAKPVSNNGLKQVIRKLPALI